MSKIGKIFTLSTFFLIPAFLAGCSTLHKDVQYFKHEFPVDYPRQLTVNEENWFSTVNVNSSEDFDELPLRDKIRYVVFVNIPEGSKKHEFVFSPSIAATRRALSQESATAVLNSFVIDKTQSAAFRLESVILLSVNLTLLSANENSLKENSETLRSMVAYCLDTDIPEKYRLPVIPIFDLMAARGDKVLEKNLMDTLIHIRNNLDRSKFLKFEMAGVLASKGDRNSLIYVISNLRRLQALENRLIALDIEEFPFSERALHYLRGVIPELPTSPKKAIAWLEKKRLELKWNKECGKWQVEKNAVRN